MTKQQIEKKWGVFIEDDSYYDWFGRFVKQYKIYSADGCRWEVGLRTIKAVEAECREWSDALMNIRRKVGVR